MGVAGDKRVFAETGIVTQVGYGDQFGAADHHQAKGELAGTTDEVRRQAVLGLEPKTVVLMKLMYPIGQVQMWAASSPISS